MFGKTLSGRKIDQAVITREPSKYELAILGALQSRRLYQGTVSDKDKVARRTRGRIAKISRKGNRGNR